MGEEFLPRRVMFGEMFEGKDYSRGQEWDWVRDLKEELTAFGVKFEGWHEATQKVGRWFRRVEERSESSCGNDTRMRRRQRQRNTGRMQPRH